MSNKNFKLEDHSILAWILRNDIKNEKGESLEFKDRKFLLDILTDWNKDIVIKKCSQVGGSVIFNLKVLFAVQKKKWNVIYTMPSDGDVEEFVKSKTNPILRENPSVFSSVSQDSIYMKQIGDRFVFFKGTISKTAAIATTADVLVHDEASRSDQMVIETYKSRTKASKIKARWLFSNPTTEKDAVDIAWQVSDKKEWNIKCPECKAEQLLMWPHSIDIERECFQCISCHAELSNETRRSGEWQAQNPESKISGYHVSHLMCAWIGAKEIIEDSKGDHGYFNNFVLGEPYNPGDLRVSRSTILDVWTPKELVGHDYYLGVDVGNVKHYVLGHENGIVEVGRFKEWSFLDGLMKKYDPTLVIDAMPETTMSRLFVDKYRKAYMCWFQENNANPQTIVWWGEKDKQGIVYAHRDRIIDQVVDDILNARWLYSVPIDDEFREYIKQWDTMRREKIVNTRGIEHYRWTSTTGQDHFALSTIYFALARKSGGHGEFIPLIDERQELIDSANTVGDLSAILAEANNWQE